MNSVTNRQSIFDIKGEADFEKLALEIFQYQAVANPVYKEYIHLLGKKRGSVKTVTEIPFLPIELFKTHQVLVEGKRANTIFESSGTTGQQASKHYVADKEMYEISFITAFRRAFGNPEGMCILALLPSYLERGNSSLVYMADVLIKLSRHPNSGFFLNDRERLAAILKEQVQNAQPTLLLGVSYALLDLADEFPMPLKQVKIMETGGMKGRREELTRDELHEILKKSFEVDKVYSEYGMTELLSQGYTDGTTWFTSPPWMKAFVRDPYDPLTLLPLGSTGAINIIDLANIYSCSFIATSDLGQVMPDGSFTVLGRMDNSELRGCNLMIE